MENKRSKAIEVGDKYYDTQSKCKNGHKSPRLTVDGSCVECRKIYQNKTREAIRRNTVNALQD